MSRPGESHFAAGTSAEIVSAVYQAATDPGCWQLLLNRLCELEHASTALLVSYNPATRIGQIREAVNVPPIYQRSYARRFATCETWMAQAKDALIPGRIWIEDVETAAVSRDQGAFYREWWQPQGIAHLLRAVVTGSKPRDEAAPGVTWIAIGRDSEAGPYGDPDREMLESILPHLGRALEIQSTIDGLRARCRATMSMFDHLPLGVVLLDRHRRPIAMNRQAQEIIGQKGGTADIIRSALGNSRGARVLAVANGKENGATGGLVERDVDSSWYCTLSRRPLIAIVRRLEADPIDGGAHQPLAVMFLSDPEDEAHIDEVMIRRLYGLTPAEARLAVLLAQGHHLDDIAEILDISIHTARTHLKRILGKTSTERQSDLVRLLLNPCTQLRM